MEWGKLLSGKRLKEDGKQPLAWEKYAISEFERDYKKIVANAGFRRLQDKTQVFPLDKSDFVRTRLTHSMEVSMIAKQLGTMVCTYISKNDSKNDKFPIEQNSQEHISEILMCAGLLHDLGNPPFGHFGETVIGEWFKKRFADEAFRFEERPVFQLLTEQMRADLEHFEGNAQTLRLLLKACHGTSNGDMNLTNATIHTLMKYPTNSIRYDKKSPDVKSHKNGYFFAEEPEVFKIAESLETLKNAAIHRHPLTFLLEAADDIAYATADLEDAFKKGLFTLEQLVSFYDDKLDELAKEKKIGVGNDIYKKAKELLTTLRVTIKTEKRTKEADAASFTDWVKFAREWLMYAAAFGFTNNYSTIMKGEYLFDVFHNTFHQLSIEALKSAMGKFVYHSKDIVKLELAAQTIINFLLDRFIPAVLNYDDPGMQSSADKKYIDLISGGFKKDYEECKIGGDPANNLYARFLMVTDFISGMTDSYAKNLYQELNGII